MKNLLIAVALQLAACATTTPPASVHMTEGKAIAAGWTSLKFAEDSADALALSGKLKGPAAAKASADIKQAHQVLTAATAAYRANPAADVSGQIAQAAALAAEILTLVSAAK
jgi:hypothetical protein